MGTSPASFPRVALLGEAVPVPQRDCDVE